MKRPLDHQPESGTTPAEASPTWSNVYRRLFSLAWPIVGVNVLQVLALAVDTAMVGRVPDFESALTGLGYATQLVFLLMVAMIGLTVGTVAFVARAHGAGLHERVDHLLHQATQLTVLLGVGVAVAGNVVAEPLLLALGADDASLGPSLDYLRPLLLGTAFNYLNLLYAAMLRGVGDTRLAFFVALLMNLLNAFFNYGLILGNYGLPALGVEGAALGTVAAQACASLAMFALLNRGAVAGLRARLRLERVDWGLARELLRVGWPAALDMVILNAAFLSIITMLGHIDQLAVGAHAVGLRVQALAFVPGMSISQATGAMVGNALGAGRVEEARRVIRASVVLCFTVMTALALTILLLASPLVELFDVAAGTPMHGYAVTWMELLGYGMPLVGIYISYAGMLQGAGETMTSLKINAVTTCAVQIPLSWLLGFPLGLGVWGVWAAFPLSFVFKAAWGVVEYRRERWARTGVEA